MRALYLLGSARPPVAGTDAVVQEAEMLRRHFGGELLFLPPLAGPRLRLPRPLHGWHLLRRIRRLERTVDLHHVYSADLYLYPALRALRKPCVWTVVSGLGDGPLPPAARLRRLGAVAVPTEGEAERLRRLGVTAVRSIAPAVDGRRFHPLPAPAEPRLTVLAGSAPWTRRQFRTKGVDALLEAARAIPELRLIFLWRGVLLDALRRRLRRAGLAGRVEVVTGYADVPALLRRAHAAVVLADRPRLVRAYPHSLLEALACGRPVLVSGGFALAEWVERTGAGRVVRGADATDLVRELIALDRRYEWHREAASRHGPEAFADTARPIGAYEELYAAALDGRSAADR